MDPLSTVKISSESLPRLHKTTEEDPVLQTLKNTILVRWPDHKEDIPLNIREYWNFREELTLHNGIRFKNQGVIIPRAMRPELTVRAHSRHQGIEACIRRAKDVVFWSAMSKDIQEALEKCEISAEFQKNNSKQPMQSHEISGQPWSRVSPNLFTLNSRDYIVLANSYSDFIEVGELLSTISSNVIPFLKQQFSRHGIPDVLVIDNGPVFSSSEFTNFSSAWEFKHVTSSPTHAKSNGKAESAVKVVRKIFKKAHRDNKDPWLALLDQRNTPTQGVASSPAQRLMSRRTRTLLPISANLLYPKVEEGVTKKLQVKRQQAKSYHDRSSIVLAELEIGQEVRVAGQRNKIWEVGTCVEKLSNRSYMVQVNEAIIHQNREALKPKRDICPHNQEETKPSPGADAAIEKEQVSDLNVQNSNKATAQMLKSGTQESTPTVPLRATRTRTVKAPIRYGYDE